MSRTGKPTLKAEERRDVMLKFISDFINQNGYPPSRREIVDACDLKSLSVADYHLEVLKEQGLISFVPKIARSIKVLSHAE